MKTIRIAVDFARLILAARPERADVKTSQAFEAVRFGLEKTKRVAKKRAPARKAKAEKKSTRRERTVLIRNAVWVRSGGKCELATCERLITSWNAWTLDHFFGGSDRRTAESLETCWGLCWSHHTEKTRNEPSALHWAEAFREHQEHHGYELTAIHRHIDGLKTEGELDRRRRAEGGAA